MEYTFALLRVYNMTRSCVLMRKFANYDTWTLPIAAVPKGDDPLTVLPALMKQIKGGVKFISAVNIFTSTSVDSPTGDVYNGVVYALDYKGKLDPDLPRTLKKEYCLSKWVQVGSMTNKKNNYMTAAFARAMLEETCLRF